MGCRPSRHSLGRVADSSWSCDKNGYFRNDSKKKKKSKNGCIDQRKPAEFNAFSSTSKIYQRTDRNVSQCSKITLRLSTDGSMLEIEKYDIDFHSNKEALFAKDTHWYSSQGNSVGQTNGSANGKPCFMRSESAPQLTYLPPKLNTISEHEDGSEKFRLRAFTSRSKSKTSKMKHSKTFACNKSPREMTLINIPRKMHGGTHFQAVNSGENNNKIMSVEQQDICIFDLESQSSDNNCRERSDRISFEKQTICENIKNERSLTGRGNSKSLCNKEILTEELPRDDTSGRISNFKCSFQMGVTDIGNEDPTDTCISGATSNHKNICDTGTNKMPSLKTLRIEIFNSINKFNELLIRKHTKSIGANNNDDCDNKTQVSIHTPDLMPSANDSTFVLVHKSSPIDDDIPIVNDAMENISDSNHNNSFAENMISAVRCVHDTTVVDTRTVPITGVENDSQRATQLDNLNEYSTINKTETTLRSLADLPPTHLSKADTKSCFCTNATNIPGTNIISSCNCHMTTLCKLCTKGPQNSAEYAQNNANVCQDRPCSAKNSGSPISNSEGISICHIDNEGNTLTSAQNVTAVKESNLENRSSVKHIVAVTSNTEISSNFCPECNRQSTTEGIKFTGISDVHTLDDGRDGACLTAVGTDGPLELHKVVSTDNFDVEATTMIIKTRTPNEEVKDFTKEDSVNNNEHRETSDIDSNCRFYDGNEADNDNEDNDQDDDDEDEFFDENYDDYDEAEEYYDARHSLYV